MGDDAEADKVRGKQGEETVIEATALEGHERLVLGTLWYDGPRPSCREEDAAFIAAARTGWPRDAARVGVLCERVALLERLLEQALDGWEDQAAMPTDGPARLRALAAGGAPPKGES